jgi:hypothetical protein
MKKILFTLCVLGVAMSGCQKYDDTALWDEVNSQAARIAALEAWQATVNGNITALQGLVNALEAHRFITDVTEFTTPAPGGYTISFSFGAPITITNGEDGAKGDKGDAGVSPQIGVAESPAGSGVYYWTLNGAFIEVGGAKLPVTGPKGDDGITPKLRINTTTNQWEMCVKGDACTEADWTSIGQATGDQGDAIFAQNGIDTSHPDYVTFTLAAGGTITLPRYKKVDITFEEPATFAASETRAVGYTLSGDVQFVKVLTVSQDWSVKVTDGGNAGTFTITAPAVLGASNGAGEAVILVSDGAERTVTRILYLATNYEEGVVLAGNTWSTRNVAAPGYFTTSPGKFGEYYQYGRAVPGVLSTYAPTVGGQWSGSANDPCPTGWRLPTEDEFLKLTGDQGMTLSWRTASAAGNYGVEGIWCGDNAAGASAADPKGSLFFPAAGYIDPTDGQYYNQDADGVWYGYYLTGTENADALAYFGDTGWLYLQLGGPLDKGGYHFPEVFTYNVICPSMSWFGFVDRHIATPLRCIKQ